MKKIRISKTMRPAMALLVLGVVVLLLSTAFCTPRSGISKTETPHTDSSNGFAVLELFTSEGCSSCPPADALLARVQKEAGDKPVYVLAYHVDYWDRLGWKDKFSDARYTERQYAYGQQFGGQVYTPQVVINGRAECVGSDEAAVGNGIENALNSTVAQQLVMTAQPVTGGMDIAYTTKGYTAGDQLLVAVVQKQAVSKVMRGENEGRTLVHAQIVRKLYTFKLKAAGGTEHIGLPDGFNRQDWEIIGMVQNPKTSVITAAIRAVIR